MKVKLVCRGRCLEGEEELERAAAGGGTLLLLASRGPPAASGAVAVRAWLWMWAQRFREWLWRRLVALARSRHAVAAGSALRPLLDVARAFLASLHPAFAAGAGPGAGVPVGEGAGDGPVMAAARPD
ncbi:hypothetical protein GPECTOR_562g585 [Gonium pectorale]|uniref:Uncharacterized protein n=1 Tax=Gonium pectorale TaxID=33097 RepID=A0A150FUK6_GONPE|nr:hypothetical protein GPECTOR_562g585 [Gonium pectorale]|eukprot:KXZ41311.1 hypothetical protein GPECTOR_562g585 [Gonium pectorale]